MQSITVKHNMEVAHRLSLTPGKCENIHGHSMWVELTLYGEIDPATGRLSGLEFGDVKTKFRKFLDTEFDHRLLLNSEDPLLIASKEIHYPGLQETEGDPTTENLALFIASWARMEFHLGCAVKVQETPVNSAAVLNIGEPEGHPTPAPNDLKWSEGLKEGGPK